VSLEQSTNCTRSSLFVFSGTLQGNSRIVLRFFQDRFFQDPFQLNNHATISTLKPSVNIATKEKPKASSVGPKIRSREEGITRVRTCGKDFYQRKSTRSICPLSVFVLTRTSCNVRNFRQCIKLNP
jgi:hypothetical protein